MGDLYCGIKLHWDYSARTVDISMPGYIKKLLKKYKHKMPTKPHKPRSQSTSPPDYQQQLSNRSQKRGGKTVVMAVMMTTKTTTMMKPRSDHGGGEWLT